MHKTAQQLSIGFFLVHIYTVQGGFGIKNREDLVSEPIKFGIEPSIIITNISDSPLEKTLTYCFQLNIVVTS